MRNFIKDQSGEFAIDAIFGITFFMISLIALMFMALIIRVQSNVQYALGQTAKEVSGYYYLIDKLGLAAVTAGSNPTGAQDINKTIQSVVDFSSSAKDFGSEVGSTVDTVKSYDSFESINFGEISEDKDKLLASFKDAEEKAKTMGADFKNLAKDPKGQAKQILSVFAKTAANSVVNNVVAPFVCEALMPKYLVANTSSTSIDDYYCAIGIKPETVSFKGSQFLADRRSIKIQITYQLDLEKYTLGFVKNKITFRQVASTAAWVRPKGENLAALNLKDMGYKE